MISSRGKTCKGARHTPSRRECLSRCNSIQKLFSNWSAHDDDDDDDDDYGDDDDGDDDDGEVMMMMMGEVMIIS